MYFRKGNRMNQQDMQNYKALLIKLRIKHPQNVLPDIAEYLGFTFTREGHDQSVFWRYLRVNR